MWRTYSNIRTIVLCSLLQKKYDAADIEPICIEFDKKHFFVFVLVWAKLVVRFFLLFFNNRPHQIVKLFLRLDSNELVLSLIFGIWDEQPRYEASDNVEYAKLEFCKEKQRSNNNFADAEAIDKKFSEGRRSQVIYCDKSESCIDNWVFISKAKLIYISDVAISYRSEHSGDWIDCD